MLPDVAHLTIANEDPLSVVKDNLDKIVAIHLKDWSPEFGRSYHFYSRGFCELGYGIVEFEALIEILREKNFKGWLVVEQDYSEEPNKSAKKSRDFLEALGV